VLHTSYRGSRRGGDDRTSIRQFERELRRWAISGLLLGVGVLFSPGRGTDGSFVWHHPWSSRVFDCSESRLQAPRLSAKLQDKVAVPLYRLRS